MGVKSAHAFFRKKGVPTETVDWDLYVKSKTLLYVDLMATCYNLVRTKMAHGKSAELIGILSSFLKHPNVIVVFDGNRSVQKELAAGKRSTQMTLNIEKHNKVLIY